MRGSRRRMGTRLAQRRGERRPGRDRAGCDLRSFTPHSPGVAGGGSARSGALSRGHGSGHARSGPLTQRNPAGARPVPARGRRRTHGPDRPPRRRPDRGAPPRAVAPDARRGAARSHLRDRGAQRRARPRARGSRPRHAAGDGREPARARRGGGLGGRRAPARPRRDRARAAADARPDHRREAPHGARPQGDRELVAAHGPPRRARRAGDLEFGRRRAGPPIGAARRARSRGPHGPDPPQPREARGRRRRVGVLAPDGGERGRALPPLRPVDAGAGPAERAETRRLLGPDVVGGGRPAARGRAGRLGRHPPLPADALGRAARGREHGARSSGARSGGPPRSRR